MMTTNPKTNEEIIKEDLDIKIALKHISDLEDIGIITVLKCMNEARASTAKEIFDELEHLFYKDRETGQRTIEGEVYKALKQKYLKLNMV